MRPSTTFPNTWLATRARRLYAQRARPAPGASTPPPPPPVGHQAKHHHDQADVECADVLQPLNRVHVRVRVAELTGAHHDLGRSNGLSPCSPIRGDFTVITRSHQCGFPRRGRILGGCAQLRLDHGEHEKRPLCELQLGHRLQIVWGDRALRRQRSLERPTLLQKLSTWTTAPRPDEIDIRPVPQRRGSRGRALPASVRPLPWSTPAIPRPTSTPRLHRLHADPPIPMRASSASDARDTQRPRQSSPLSSRGRRRRGGNQSHSWGASS